MADWLLLPVGLVIVLVAGGIAVVGLAAAVFLTPSADDRRHSDLDAAEARIVAMDAPTVRAVAIGPNRFGRPTLMVTLGRRAWTTEARVAWCEVVLPTGIGREFVEVHSPDGQWRAPADCADATSKPELLGSYLDFD